VRPVQLMECDDEILPVVPGKDVAGALARNSS
jgi:hypothetical protein